MLPDIQSFFKTYKQSAWDKNVGLMMSMYDEDIVIFDMWDEGYVKDYKAWHKLINDWLSSLGEDRVNVEFEMINVVQQETVGFATALILFQAISPEGKVLRGMKNRITIGLTKTAGGWKVKHQHTSAPVSGNGLKAILDI